MTTTPIYDAVHADLGWSLEDLGPPFDPAGSRLNAEAIFLGRAMVARSLRAHMERVFAVEVNAAVEQFLEAEESQE